MQGENNLKIMRDYPSVPNVFRAASSHSINNESTYAPPFVGSGYSSAVGGNSNLSPISVRQQQQQARLQQQNQTILNGQHQPTQKPKQQHHEQQLHYGPDMAHANQLKTNNKLTTSASVEGRALLHRGEQHSPYATLPRSMTSVNGDSELRPPPPEHNSRNGVVSGSGGHFGAGVINTISGRIPATKFDKARATAMGSNLDISQNNSCTDLSRLSGLQQQQQKQPPVHEQTTTSAGLSDYPKQWNSCSKIERNKGGYLWILTPVAASISVAIVIAALAGPQWLFTEEKLPNANYNGTTNFNALDDGAFITKFTKSSLWILCSTLQGVGTYNCIKIDYFPKEGYQPDPHDSTPAIPYTVTKSCPFFVASGIFLLISFVVFLIPTCSHQNNLYYFSAGIMFIVSGLLMLIGLIAYISILKAEIGSKLRTRSTLQPALFKVTYGQSFFLFVFGFISTEFVGLLNIFLYISLQEVGYYSRLPCFTISNLHDKIKEGENPRSHTYKSYTHATGRKTPQLSKHSNNNNKNHKNNHHQVHDVNLIPEVDGFEDKKLLQQWPTPVCLKHPLKNNLDRKFFFEKPPQSKCSLHSKNLAKSLNELYTEPAPPVGPPPPPSAIKVRGTQTLPRLQDQASQFMEMRQDIPMTCSVSTTTDIFAADGSANSRNTTQCLERKNNRRNIATNTRFTSRGTDEQVRGNGTMRLEEETSVMNLFDKYVDEDEPEHGLCGLRRGARKTKDELFLEFSKRNVVRPNPQNIYYIGNDKKQQHRCNGLSGRNKANAVRNDESEDDNESESDDAAFKPLQEDDDHIFIIEDNSNYTNSQMRNYRRASMYIEPMHLRKLNSHHSLHSLYPLDSSRCKTSQYDLERRDSSVNLWQRPPFYETHYNKDDYGGSQSHLHYRDYNPQMYQSRTLPRSFLKRNASSQDSITSASFHSSNTGLHNSYYNATQRHPQHLTSLQFQQQSLQQNRQSQYSLQKSCEDVSSSYLQPQIAKTTSYAAAARKQLHITAAAAVSSSHTKQLPITALHWPTAIPSAPALPFPNNIQRNAVGSNVCITPHHGHDLITRTASGDAAGQPKIQLRRSSAAVTDAFDLDEIERERRHSHASLFSSGGSGDANLLTLGPCSGGAANTSEHYDFINGTAV